MLEGLFYDDETRALIDRGFQLLFEANREMADAWGFGNTQRWDADLEAGTLTFTNPGVVVVAPVQVVGSYIPSSLNWLWAWANPNVDPRLACHAEKVRDLGFQRDLGRLTQPEATCLEEDAWSFTALACVLGGGKGAYCGPVGEDLYVFMTFGTPVVH